MVLLGDTGNPQHVFVVVVIGFGVFGSVSGAGLLDFAVAAFDAVLVFIAPFLFVGDGDIVFVAAVSDLAMVDDAATLVFTVGAVSGTGSSFAPGNAVSEDVFNEVRSSDSDFVQSERR